MLGFWADTDKLADLIFTNNRENYRRSFIVRKYDKEWLSELCKDSYSYAEVLRKAGRCQGGGS